MTRHPREIASDIRLIVAEQRYADATPLLNEYATAIVEHCNGKADQVAFEEAKLFLKRTIQTIKAQKAHDGARLGALRAERAYLSESDESRWSMLG